MRRHTVAHCLVFVVLAWLLCRVARGGEMSVHLVSAVVPSQAPFFDHLRTFEGFRLKPYRDPGDRSVWCVGLGHSLTAHGEPVKASYTEAEVMTLFQRDRDEALAACRAAIVGFDTLPIDAQTVCVSVAWTTGTTGLMRFTDFRRAMSHRAYNAAATTLGLSKWRSQVKAARFNWCLSTLRSLP